MNKSPMTMSNNYLLREEILMERHFDGIRISQVAAAVLALLLMSAPVVAQAQVLYGLAHDNPTGSSSFYLIDSTTGNPTYMGAVGFSHCTGLDFDSNGDAYAVCLRSQDLISVLVRIDIRFGAGMEIGPTGIEALLAPEDPGPANFFDISFRNADDVLFAKAIDDNAQPAACVTTFTINTATGAATPLPVSNTCDPGNALGFVAADTLYHTDKPFQSLVPGTLYTVDQVTGADTPLVPVGAAPCIQGEPPPRLNAFDAHPTTDVMYASSNCGNPSALDSRLSTIDLTTGVVTEIGATVDGLGAIAWGPDVQRRGIPVTTPIGVAALTIALATIAVAILRRR